MCGIAGAVAHSGEPVGSALIQSMLAALRHRGPDDSGVFVSGAAGLGHVRLSIIDLSPDARQPMANEAGDMYVVHNGEIYNYRELRPELERRGHRFRSHSDTEVIVHAYEEWGERCLERFNGMWAFAILDLKRRELFCSRDRFGVKPFYYSREGGIFVFASEIKALLRHPKIRAAADDAAVYQYLASGYGYMDVTDGTFFRGIRQLKPGHYARVSLATGEFIQRRYWDIDPRRERRVRSDEEAVDRFTELFTDAVRLRLRSDVPVAVSLSGGLDSSSIACIAACLLGGSRLDAFSSCFDEKEYDERQYIEPVLEKTLARPHFVFTKPDHLFADMEEIIWHQDEPYSTMSIFPQWNVMKHAHAKGIKVMLTGQGGDEVLGGYHKYYFYLFADLLRSGRWHAAAREMRRYREHKGAGVSTVRPALKIVGSYLVPESVKRSVALAGRRTEGAYLHRDFVRRHAARIPVECRFPSILNNDLYNALKISPLPSLLHIDDRSSMAHSVESRSPFLDYRLVEYLFSLGPRFKIRDGVTKYLLRRAMKGVLPETVRTRRDKMGYATPLDHWFRTHLREPVREILTSRAFTGRPYFDAQAAREKLDAFLRGDDTGGQYTIWSWVNLELWFRKFIDA